MSNSSHQERWPDLAGRIEGSKHILPVRVYFEDTDFTGLVFHGTFVRWFERGRSDFVRLLGIHHDKLMSPDDGSEPAAFVVRHIEIDYLLPAKIDDVLEIVTETLETGGAVLLIGQSVLRDGKVIARAKVKVVLINQSGKPLRIDRIVRGAFHRLMGSDVAHT